LLKRLETGDSQTLAPPDLGPILGAKLPDIASTGVEEDGYYEKVDEAFGDVEGWEGGGAPGGEERVEEGRGGGSGEVTPAGVRRNLVGV
jgi:hypothetical protein